MVISAHVLGHFNALRAHDRTMLLSVCRRYVAKQLTAPLYSVICAAALALSAVGSAHAANYQGTVTSVFPYNGAVFVVLNGGGFDGPASVCLAGGNMVYRIDLTTVFGRALMATALSAKLSGKQVYAAGDGVCAGTPYGASSAEGLVGMDLKG
jgi:hypothetical protein